MLKATSRKHRMVEERQEKINHENKLLYKKMTAILKKGSGNVSPIRKQQTSVRAPKERQGDHNEESYLLQHGRSVTARPGIMMQRRISQQRNSSSKNIIEGVLEQEGRSYSPIREVNIN